MKKNTFGWMTIAWMVFVCVGFTACGGDDGEGSSSIPSGPQPSIDDNTTFTIPQGTYYATDANVIKDRVDECINAGDFAAAKELVNSNNDGWGAGNAAIEVVKGDKVAWISVYSSLKAPGLDAILVETKTYAYPNNSFTAYFYLYEQGYEYDNLWSDAATIGFSYSNGVITHYYMPKSKNVTYIKVK